MVKSGEAKSLKVVAERKVIENSYTSRMVNLTTTAPDIVAAILGDALPSHYHAVRSGGRSASVAGGAAE